MDTNIVKWYEIFPKNTIDNWKYFNIYLRMPLVTVDVCM